MLRRYQPISRAGQWRDTVRVRDLRTRALQTFADAVLTMALYQRRYGARTHYDYGRAIPGWGLPVLTATTQADGSGPFVILPDQVTGLWTFPSGSLSRLWPGDALLIIWATVAGQTDEIQRDTLLVLDGPVSVPGQAATVAPTPAQSITVILDGGRI